MYTCPNPAESLKRQNDTNFNRHVVFLIIVVNNISFSQDLRLSPYCVSYLRDDIMVVSYGSKYSAAVLLKLTRQPGFGLKPFASKDLEGFLYATTRWLNAIRKKMKKNEKQDKENNKQTPHTKTKDNSAAQQQNKNKDVIYMYIAT